LQADGLSVSVSVDLLAQGGSPRILREALRATASVVVCLSQRALPAGVPETDLARALELLALTPHPRRLTLALRLTSCNLPAALRSATALDLFSARGYEQVRNQLQAHAAASQPIAPVPPPPAPVRPRIPALALQGAFALPELERHGLERRLGRGVARAIFLIDPDHALVVSGGGPALVPLTGGPPLWAIDCPTRCAALSPQARLLALANGTQLTLWDLADGSLRGLWQGHTAAVQALAFAPDGRTLASASRDRSIRLWRIGDNGRAPSLLATLADQADHVTSLAYSPDGNLLAAGGADRTVRVWRTFDRARVQTLGGLGGKVEALAFSPDGQTLAAGSRDRQLRLWETQSWRLLATLDGHHGAIEALAFSPDSSLIATGAADQQIYLWRRADAALVGAMVGHRGPITGLAFNPDGTTLASVAEDERLLLWTHTSGLQKAALRVLSGRITSLALSADGAMLAVGMSDGATTLYHVSDEAAPRLRQREHLAPVISSAFASPTQLVTADAERTVRLCHSGTGTSAILMQTHGAMHVAALAPNGQVLVSSDGEGTVQLWRLTVSESAPGSQFWRVLRGVRGRPVLVRFSPLADQLVIASDSGSLSLWRLADLRNEQEEPALHVRLASGRARCLALSADGSLLAAGDEQGAVTLWQTHNGSLMLTLPGQGYAATSLAFAPDGRSFAMGNALGMLQIWRLHGNEVQRRPPTTIHGHAGAVEQLHYSPRGGLLVSGSADGTVRLWRV
ncbi:MAG: WD40 repeat domain-containing protein, partial [Oscillochloridaceae bacterium umkhey_bin13]